MTIYHSPLYDTYAELEAATLAGLLTTTATHGNASHAYGLPHAPNRPGQLETIRWLEQMPADADEDSTGQCVVLHAPTGSGKTSFAAAMGHNTPTIALVKTKLLQVENYEKSYGFTVLYGQGNYKCAHPDAELGAMCDACMFREDQSQCDVVGDCPYLRRKAVTQAARKASLNYPYWLSARWPKKRLTDEAGRGYLFCDEAHQLSDITLEHSSVTITMRQRLEWDMPSFPIIRGGTTASDAQLASDWLGDALDCVEVQLGKCAPGSKGEQRALAMIRKLGNVVSALGNDANDWYVRSGPGILEQDGGRYPGFIARPLTARFHFPRLFLGHWRTVVMTATVGDPATFAAELGLPSTHVYKQIPNAFDAVRRPVRVLNAPAMGQKVRDDEGVQMEQARVIAEAVNECPRDWSGLIHVTSKTQAAALVGRLSRCGLGPRLWSPGPMDSTDWQLKTWQRFRDTHSGALAVVWAWWEGYDGRNEKISIVTKTPFPNIADEYERERMRYDGKFYLQRAAWQLEQALGRSRRGVDSDYDTPEQRNGLVAIADANYHRVAKYLSPDIQEAIVTN